MLQRLLQWLHLVAAEGASQTPGSGAAAIAAAALGVHLDGWHGVHALEPLLPSGHGARHVEWVRPVDDAVAGPLHDLHRVQVLVLVL